MTEPYEVEPLAAPPNVTVRVPGSRSFTNRALVAAALADGTSRIEGALTADDTEAMADNLARLRIPVVADPEAETIEVEGTAGRLPDGQLRAGCPPVRHDEPLPAAPAGPRARSLPARRPRAAAHPADGQHHRCAAGAGGRGARGGRDGPPPRHRGRTRARWFGRGVGRRVQPVPVGPAAGGPGDAAWPAGHPDHRAGGPTVRRDDPGDDGGVRGACRGRRRVLLRCSGRVPGHDLRGRARRRGGRVLLRRRRAHRWPRGRGGPAPAIAARATSSCSTSSRRWART